MAYAKNILVEKAKQFAHDAHDSIQQKRKYTGLPYWVHTDEVSAIVEETTHDPVMVAAAELHDVEEDVHTSPYDIATIRDLFGDEVADIVVELTDVYTHEAYPHLNRATRKAAEAVRLSGISPKAQTIKYADFISNTADITKNDPNFARTYLREKRAILINMTDGDAGLFARANAQVNI